MCICICVCMCVYMYICIYVCMYGCMYVYMYVCIYVYMCIRVYVCVYVLGDQIGTIPEVSLEYFVRGQRSNMRFEHILVALNYCFSTINKEKKINKLSELKIFWINVKSLNSVILTCGIQLTNKIKVHKKNKIKVVTTSLHKYIECLIFWHTL